MEKPTGPFPRVDRLRTPTEFRAVSRRGRRSGSGKLVLLVLEREGGCRLGVTVSRKVGNAVVRNRIKRWIREWFRGARGRMKAGADVVVIARPEIRSLGSAELVDELDSRARELGLFGGGARV